jgi:membrane-associated phospholipid phosphatase
MWKFRPGNHLQLLCFFTIFSFQVTYAFSEKDSVPEASDKKARYFRPAGIIIPSAFLVYGCLKPVIPAIENLDNQIMENIRSNHPDFKTSVDDYLQWLPSASVYAMDALKVKTKHTFIEHLAIDAGSIIITGGAGFILRKISGNIEVYNATGSQFPSGHTANAFRGAEIVFQELKDTHRVLSYSGYLVASAVGVLRIYNKAHYLTEVLAGAGLGILSTKLTYLAFDKVKAHRKRKSPAPLLTSR